MTGVNVPLKSPKNFSWKVAGLLMLYTLIMVILSIYGIIYLERRMDLYYPIPVLIFVLGLSLPFFILKKQGLLKFK